jgi:predicted RNA binding protein YcfA (HicA-like mRNA interferase family)
MARDYYDEVVRILRRAGWTKASGGKGSHEKWIDADGKRVVIVPRSKSRHTANEVLKQAGLPKAF